MSCPIITIPQEVLQRILLFATSSNGLGPPTDLRNCLLTCWRFKEVLSPECAGELWSTIFADKFDVLAPVARLSPFVMRENAAIELRRRFAALKILKNQQLDHPSLREALWIAYLMIYDSDTSQRNVQQLLRVGLPSFLDFYLCSHLYEGAEKSNGWPTVTEESSLVIALSWVLASQTSIDREDQTTLDHARNLLRPITFASLRYPIFSVSEDQFDFGQCKSPSPFLRTQEIVYFGNVKRNAQLPTAALFAILLYFARTDSVTPFKVPKHIIYKTREEASQNGYGGLCVDDYEHYYRRCRTKFADFPAFNIGFQSFTSSSSPNAVLCHSRYKLGTLTGMWQGSQIIPYIDGFRDWLSGPTMSKVFGFDGESRSPVYFTLEEHYCCDQSQAVPIDDEANGMKNAWLPVGLRVQPTKGGMMFSGQDSSFQTVYRTYRCDQPPSDSENQVVDVIITGKTENRYTAWGGGIAILGRVRIRDGLMVLVKFLPGYDLSVTQIFRGYVTTSQNFVGRVKGPWNSKYNHYEGIFSMSKN